MKKTREEVMRVLARKINVGETGLEELKYWKAVIEETLRQHPSGPLLAPRENSASQWIRYMPIKTEVTVNAWALECWKGSRLLWWCREVLSIDIFGLWNCELYTWGCEENICPGLSFVMANLVLLIALFCTILIGKFSTILRKKILLMDLKHK